MAVVAGVGAAAPASWPSIAMKSTAILAGAAEEDDDEAAAVGVLVLATGMGAPADETLDGMIG
jgi:hypothetical protein